ncbi:MAG: ABC transporter ATP-binding protein [Lachnospiraceae bacterium]|nr:ABC transporter ATP-binding protein [Lachnospiraceae bacterium]
MVLKQLTYLLDRKQKFRVGILLIMMIIGALFETMGVSLIIPFISVIMNPDMIHTNKYLAYVYQSFHLQSENQFMIVIVLVLILTYLVKNLFLLLLYYVQARFVTNNQFRMSRDLLINFMSRPYEYYLNASTGDIIRIVQWDVGNVFMLINNMLLFLSELFVLIALVVLLLVVNLSMTISISALLGATLILSKTLFKKHLEHAGEQSQKYSSVMNKWLLQSVDGIKEIKVCNKEHKFVQQYQKSGYQFAKAQRKNSILSQSPRLLIETISMCGMLGFIAFLLLQGRNIETMFAQLTAFAMAAVRLMPSANRMNTYLNAISFLKPSLNTVYENIQYQDIKSYHYEEASHEIKNRDLKQEIAIEHIQYAYPNAPRDIFQDASMVIPVGKSVAVIGASGAGKTTVIDILLGLLQPQKGKITFDGIDVAEDYQGWLSKIGYIPQTIFMLDGSIKDNIAFGLDDNLVDEDRVWQVLEDAQLAEHIRSLPEGIHTQIGEKGVRLSGGQRQRLGIARALYHNPEVLVFDEATSALDNETEAAIMESINRFQGEKTMVIIAHRLGTIQDCDYIYKVEDGKIRLERQKSE